jgi:hypothetical protein
MLYFAIATRTHARRERLAHDDDDDDDDDDDVVT